jgi:hypothetical protein
MCGADQALSILGHPKAACASAALVCQRELQVGETYPGGVVTSVGLTRALEIEKI